MQHIADRWLPVLDPQVLEAIYIKDSKGTLYEYLSDKSRAQQHVQHYEEDALAFDYFEGPQDGATIHENHRLHQSILKSIDQNSEYILDVGCGGAWLAKVITKQKKNIISMDVSSKNPAKASNTYTMAHHLGMITDVYDMPFKKHSIDTIVASEIMEHVPNPKSFVSALLSILKPTGSLIITTPYNENIQHSLCIHCNQKTPHHAHLHSFNEENIKRLIPVGYKYSFAKFSNKYLAKLRTHVFMRFLPYYMWTKVDHLANWISPKETRLQLVIQKS